MQITIIANQGVHTPLFPDILPGSVVMPYNIFHPSQMDIPYICVRLHNILIIVEGAKLWPIHTKNVPIKISDALECKSRVALLALCLIKIACRL